MLADPPLLERVVANLVDNAVRHTPPGQKVLVTASALARRVELRVVDRGPGLPPTTATASSSPSSGSATPTTPPASASDSPSPGA